VEHDGTTPRFDATRAHRRDDVEIAIENSNPDGTASPAKVGAFTRAYIE
jgi:hypothetical protein